MHTTRFNPSLSFLLISLTFAALSFGHEEIVDGVVVQAGDPLAKFTVRIFLPDGKCTGTLIEPNIVLTAAHCVVDETTQKIIPYADSVKVGFDRFDAATLEAAGTTTITADKVILDRGYIGLDSRHTTEDYGPTSPKNHDVALIRLSQNAPAEFKPIPLARASEIAQYGNTLTLAGYGRESAAADATSGRLKSASVTLTDSGPDYAVITTEYGSGLGCYGDSGGPLLIRTPLEGYKLAGVHNSGMGDCTGANAAARIADYADFLDQAMRRLGSSAAHLFTVAAPPAPTPPTPAPPTKVARHSFWPSPRYSFMMIG